MLTHPSAGGIKRTPVGTINCTGSTPYISVVMGYPPSCTVHIFCRLLSCYGHIFYHLNKWFMQFCKICFFCRPVIHFSVDVNGVFAIPWWIDLIIPYSLEVGSLSAWLRRRN